ncbi:815_t:CDS:2 [Funneliformis caledonium]|uniref:815_t:CDS:1 n=1 Tax=Funneliformis caledonium TaxID=1117310 RepID=A0A9N9BIL1_9GLOM|nr:815_t:CDS:2 [Funneliformis caledonium]
MASEMHQLTPAGRIKKPSYSTIAKWVMDSWNDVDTVLICKSFKCCGISVARDGNEVEISESDNELESDLPLEYLEFNGYDEELPNYENNIEVEAKNLLQILNINELEVQEYLSDRNIIVEQEKEVLSQSEDQPHQVKQELSSPYALYTSQERSPTEFLNNVIGRPVLVKLNSGVDYRGILSCLDGYMNIALEQTEEWVNGQLKNKYGDAFIRGNNGIKSIL